MEYRDIAQSMSVCFYLWSLTLFADDTAIITSSDKPTPIIKRFQSSISKIQYYFLNWKIEVNFLKTQCIYFFRKRKFSNLPFQGLKFRDSTVNWSDSDKCLGINFNKRLTFESHIDDAFFILILLLE